MSPTMAHVARSWVCNRCMRKSSRWLSASIAQSKSYSTTIDRHDQPFRMAVVGSGPAGFYTAYRVMSKIKQAKVDMYEALPVPFGLVRFGVAPDHPEVKNCQEKFEEVASSPNFTFVGNVSIGNPGGHFDNGTVPLNVVLRHYDAVVFAYGASKDKTLGIPGETELEGVYSARDFVGWYNGLPEFANLKPDLTSGEDAVIIGQGNVALDVARMLLENVDVLRKSDITEAAVDVLSKSRIKRVHVVGRRGPMQAAFTIKEVRELMKLHSVGFNQIDMSLIPDEVSKLPRAQRRLMEVLIKGSSGHVENAAKTWSLDFCLSPAGFIAAKGSPAHVGATIFKRTSLSDPFDPAAKVEEGGGITEVPSSTVFRSIGYKSVGLPGFDKAGISFDDQKGVITNDGQGRVFQADESKGALLPKHLPGVYCAGWVKRGPTGVIASTMQDAFSTADAVTDDWQSGASFLAKEDNFGWDAVRLELPNVNNAKVVGWHDWRKIDMAERERGTMLGKEREKFTKTSDMLSIL